MRSDNQNKSIHFFHVYAALDRVNCLEIPDDEPCGDMSTLPLSAFVPSADECSILRLNYATLLSRIVVEKLDYFKMFQGCVVKHIQHKHSDVMKKKSVVVSSVGARTCMHDCAYTDECGCFNLMPHTSLIPRTLGRERVWYTYIAIELFQRNDVVVFLNSVVPFQFTLCVLHVIIMWHHTIAICYIQVRVLPCRNNANHNASCVSQKLLNVYQTLLLL